MSGKLQVASCKRGLVASGWSLVMCLILTGHVFAATSLDPMKLGVGARSLAMGRTSVVEPGDANAMFVNPANAAYLKPWALTSMYTSMLEDDIKYTLLGAAKEMLGGTAGLAYMAGATTGLAVTTRDASGRVTTTGSGFDYTNSTITLAYGREVNDKLAAGGSVKVFSKSFGSLGSGSGFDMDLGMLYKARDNMNLGLAVQNVLPVGLTWNTGVQEDTPMLIKAGMDYRIRDNLLFVADADVSPFALHSGIEWQLNKMLAIRAGYENYSAGNSSVSNIGLGAGLNFKGISFDYAYFKDGALDSNSTHFFTLSFKPELPATKEAVAPATTEAPAIKAPVATPEAISKPVKKAPVVKKKKTLKRKPAVRKKKAAVKKKKPAVKKKPVATPRKPEL